MLIYDLRWRVLAVCLLLVALCIFAGWLIWSNSVDRTPTGGVLVWQEVEVDVEKSAPTQLVHPFYLITTRRVMV